MNEYSIQILNGKVMGDSVFFLFVNDLLTKESNFLCNFTDSLDKEPVKKNENIAEYKCAKYRYAAVTVIQNAIYHSNLCRKQHNLEYSHYLLLPYDELFKAHTEYLDSYESAPTNERPDYSLYYAMVAFADKEITELEAKLQNATDWESIELKEHIGGFNFAKECLNEAWQKRMDVIA